MAYLWVGLGGGLGAMARHGLARLSTRLWSAAWLPMGTLIANVLGCLLIGWIAGRIDEPSRQAFWWFGVTGFLGGFTTFSAFGLEHVTLAQRHGGIALLHAALHVGLGLAAAWGGYLAGRAL